MSRSLEKNEHQLAKLDCHFAEMNYNFGPGKLIATNQRLFFYSNDASLVQGFREFSYEKLKPIRKRSSRQPFKFFSKLLAPDEYGWFMYDGEVYTITLLSVDEGEFEEFVNIVNEQINNKRNRN
ncbi:hypothetical protein LF817_13225 [Halobacillus sp. A1]|uniref:PH domain-containing protein n=1 Tax=Halobacillus sp. A1 TaxID=2880262 RepID=UPI0020A635D7|nr:PH domain-containing protein [Halobacillus sp. A1]MCP3032303.1 hypothetical protein [Halobacillus sp. A1]